MASPPRSAAEKRRERARHLPDRGAGAGDDDGPWHARNATARDCDHADPRGRDQQRRDTDRAHRRGHLSIDPIPSGPRGARCRATAGPRGSRWPPGSDRSRRPAGSRPRARAGRLTATTRAAPGGCRPRGRRRDRPAQRPLRACEPGARQETAQPEVAVDDTRPPPCSPDAPCSARCRPAPSSARHGTGRAIAAECDGDYSVESPPRRPGFRHDRRCDRRHLPGYRLGRVQRMSYAPGTSSATASGSSDPGLDRPVVPRRPGRSDDGRQPSPRSRATAAIDVAQPPDEVQRPTSVPRRATTLVRFDTPSTRSMPATPATTRWQRHVHESSRASRDPDVERRQQHDRGVEVEHGQSPAAAGRQRHPPPCRSATGSDNGVGATRSRRASNTAGSSARHAGQTMAVFIESDVGDIPADVYSATGVRSSPTSTSSTWTSPSPATTPSS